jgi:hypothetical protein
MSSLRALEWLRAAGPSPAALVVVPLDGDVVAALGQPEAQGTAFSAVDLIVEAAGEGPLAACLHKPTQTVGVLGVAQAAVGALSERYTDRFAYVFGCDMSGDREWQRALAQAALKSPDPVAGHDRDLIPLSAGAPIEVRTISANRLNVASVRGLADGSYVAPEVPIDAAPDVNLLQRASDVLESVAHVGLVLLQPHNSSDAAAIAAVTRTTALEADELPQGYSSAISTGIAVTSGWQTARVGTLTYLQAQQPGAALSVTFVGSELYVLGLRSPEGGELEAWLDRDPQTSQAPDARLSFAADQARDAVLDVFGGLAAMRHRVTFVVAQGSIVVAGLFVAGKAQVDWASGFAAVGLLIVGVAALGDLSYSAIQQVRGRSPVPTRRRRRAHPREFERTR